ncbi:DUF2970 domain-containing protein [Candidatus Uhrbacteria bacterium]|nr:DUF2970 domain-containing protein [Candidatus Uhrbacteria bacterium]
MSLPHLSVIRLLACALFVFFVSGNPSIASAKEYTLAITFMHDSATSTMKVGDLQLVEGRARIDSTQEDSGHTLRILSAAKTVLFTTRFTPPASFGLPLTPEAAVSQKESDNNFEATGFPVPFFTVEVPYLLDAQTIEVLDPRQKPLLSTPVPPLEKLVDIAIDQVIEVQEGRVPKLPMPSRAGADAQEDSKLIQPNNPYFIVLGTVGAGLFVLAIVLLVRRMRKGVKTV